MLRRAVTTFRPIVAGGVALVMVAALATSVAMPSSAAPAAAVTSHVVEAATLPPTTRRRIPAPLQGFKQIRLVVISANGRERIYCAALADQPAAQQRGMMGRSDIGGHDAMVFLFESEQQEGGFWMRTVPVGLDIAWYSGRARWVDGTTMAPCGDDPDCPVYPANLPYRYAVETLVGDAKRLGLVEGSRIRLDGRCR